MASIPTVTISASEYALLLAMRAKLEALYAWGVDNWEYYDDAMEEVED